MLRALCRTFTSSTDTAGLNRLQLLVTTLQRSTSSIEKTAQLGQFADCRPLLRATYDPSRLYGLTVPTILAREKTLKESLANPSVVTPPKKPKKMKGATVDEVKDSTQPSPASDAPSRTLIQLLDDLDNRTLTGHAAIDAVLAYLNQHSEHRALILDIIGRNLKIRCSTSLINKALPYTIPEFSVALAQAYVPNKENFESTLWFASRKLDGVRCLTVIKRGNITHYSRMGHRFETLQHITEHLQTVAGLNHNDGCVLDGELVVFGDTGNDDFTSVVSGIRKKEHTMVHAKYIVFDMLSIDEFENGTGTRLFSDRLAALEKAFKTPIISHQFVLNPPTALVTPIIQVAVKSEQHLTDLFAGAKDNGWEGLIIRADRPYVGKRSNHIQKLKEFMDEELTVIEVETGPIRVVENGREVERQMMTNLIVDYKGNRVSVGSGFSMKQRAEYFEHPDRIIGKQITVQYFGVNEGANGALSLRFPTCKHVHTEGDRRE